MSGTVLRFACLGCGKVFEQDVNLPENNVSEDLLHLCGDKCRPKALEDLQNGAALSVDVLQRRFGRE